MKNQISIVAGLLLLGVISRFLPHPPNFTAIMAIGLFAGYQFRGSWLAVAVSLGAMLISDLFLGFHETFWAVYLCIAAVALWGSFGLKKARWYSVGLSAMAGSVIFYLVTNAAHWYFVPMYSQDSTGLMQSYIAGLPFLRNGLLGDLFYNTVFFGGLALLTTAFKVQPLKA